MRYEIEISTDEQQCLQCKEKGKGFYKRPDNQYMCENCIFENLEYVIMRDWEKDEIDFEEEESK